MIATVAVAAIVSFLAPGVVYSLTSSWKWKDQDATSVRRILKTSAVTGLGTATVCGGASWAAAALAWDDAPWLAAAIPALLLVLILYVNLKAAGPVGRVMRLAKQLKNPKKREGARRKILAIVEKTHPTDEIGRTLHVMAALALANDRYDADGLRLFEDIPAEDLDGHLKELRAMGILTCRAALGDAEGARAALAELPKLEPGSLHDQVRRSTEALILVHEGKSEQALELLLSEPTDEQLSVGSLVIKAHAFAGAGRVGEMHECLAEIERKHGRDGIERAAIIVPGPASSHARAMLRDDAGGYRGAPTQSPGRDG